MTNENTPKVLPDWLMLLIFAILVVTLWIFADVFTGICGMLILIRIFHLGYNRAHANDDH